MGDHTHQRERGPVPSARGSWSVIPLPLPENGWQMGLWPNSGRRLEQHLRECLEQFPRSQRDTEGREAPPFPLSGLCLPLCEDVLPGPAEAILRRGKTSPHAKDRTEGQKAREFLMTQLGRWINQSWNWPPSRPHYVTQYMFLLFMPLLIGLYVTTKIILIQLREVWDKQIPNQHMQH